MPFSFSRNTLQTTTLVTSLLLGTAAFTPAAAAPAAAQAPAKSQAAKQIEALADAFYVARAKFDPLMMTANGDGRYDDQLGATIVPAARSKQFALYHRMQKQLAAISRDGLSDKDKLNAELLAFELANAVNLEQFPEHLLPLNQFDNVPSTLANYAGGAGSQPLGTVKQYGAYLSRLNQLPAWIDQAIVNMREGIRQGVVQPKSITLSMLPQLRNMRSTTPEASVFYTPIKNLPAQFSDADKKKLTAAYRHTIASKLAPALDKLVRFLETDYLAASRETSGMGALPNGAAWYLARIKDNTNLPLTPDEVHALGLKEVARIQQQWATLGPKLGYTGPADALPQWVAKQEKFMPFTTDQQILDAYAKIDAAVRLKLPALFSVMPKGAFALQLEPELSRATASNHYTPPAADGSHPGVFWVVVRDPKKYSTTGMATLFVHEGQPGHHFHAALLKEMDLPDFRKFNTEYLSSAAYAEGWGLYAETLGHEMGLYEQPDAYYGHLQAELTRAARLVVDTGLHAKGWTREQAINYISNTLGVSEAAARNQAERYMVWPAQALAYKIGALKILELRARAQQALGDKFSLAKFHEVVLGEGTLPLPILEAQVSRWIAVTKAP